MKTYKELTDGEKELARAHAFMRVVILIADQLDDLPIEPELKKTLGKLVKAARRKAAKLGDERLAYRLMIDKLDGTMDDFIERMAASFLYLEPGEANVIAGIVGRPQKGKRHAPAGLFQPPTVPRDPDPAAGS